MSDDEALRSFCQRKYCRSEADILYRGVGLCGKCYSAVPQDMAMDYWILKNTRPAAASVARANGAKLKHKSKKRRRVRLDD